MPSAGRFQVSGLTWPAASHAALGSRQPESLSSRPQRRVTDAMASPHPVRTRPTRPFLLAPRDRLPMCASTQGPTVAPIAAPGRSAAMSGCAQLHGEQGRLGCGRRPASSLTPGLGPGRGRCLSRRGRGPILAARRAASASNSSLRCRRRPMSSSICTPLPGYPMPLTSQPPWPRFTAVVAAPAASRFAVRRGVPHREDDLFSRLTHALCLAGTSRTSGPCTRRRSR
jgi:hypothetical protein